ncbi:eCIS core domain-containing protein [Kriegella aquimaris]|uniref:eCIS core domain-containing protein n=1 Tax=Kriegella aquimaris TaxID=192904 RepID=A0A1G9N973_9FLAO|nr:DUF4157 domain-containing protein [Kriegella aquimaris]SDL82697.1 protein of unknown function [Kriegella aquimaris]
MRRKHRRLPSQQVAGNEMFFKPPIQRKLKVGRAGDAYEMEADAIADKVVSNSESSPAVQKMGGTEEEMQQKPLAKSVSTLQREGLIEKYPVRRMEEEEPLQQQVEEEVQTQSEEQEEPVQREEEEESVQQMEEENTVQQQEEEVQTQSEEEEEPVQRMEEEKSVQQMEEEETAQPKPNKKSGSRPSLESSLMQSKGGGNKMNAIVRQEMESRFGADFSDIRIHTDDNAVQMSKELGAQAFTHGKDIYFNEGKYNPNSKEGQHLLAHELTHTIQQKGIKAKSKNEQPEVPIE